MAKYIRVDVFRGPHGDASNFGITFTHNNKLVVPCPGGNITGEQVEEYGYIILTLQSPVMQGGAPYFDAELDIRKAMFGGNFVWSTDGRFRKRYGQHPIKVFDRIE